MKDLDRRLSALGRVDIDHNLGGLEQQVWARVDAQSHTQLTPLPRRFALAACALIAFTALATGLGVGAAQASPDHASVFDLHPRLAPSTALDN